MEQQHRDRFEAEIRGFFSDTLRRNGGSLRRVAFLAATALRQSAARRRRALWSSRGVTVPPLMIASVTGKCNLRCAGCYDRSLHAERGAELEQSRFVELLRESDELGLRIVLVAGGEPFARPDLLSVLDRFPGMLFPVFTNGLLLDDAAVRRLRRRPGIVPIVSLEGGREETDARRGRGVFDAAAERVQALRRAGILFGHSITVTTSNLDAVTDPAYVSGLQENGARIFFFVEYVPVQAGTEALVPDEADRRRLMRALEELRKRTSGLFIAFPGDEEAMGGCLAAGRGFIHVSASGDVEPCPFSPYSDVNLNTATLKEALASDLLRRIRASRGMLVETGGCALWSNRDRVAELAGVVDTKSYR